MIFKYLSLFEDKTGSMLRPDAFMETLHGSMETSSRSSPLFTMIIVGYLLQLQPFPHVFEGTANVGLHRFTPYYLIDFTLRNTSTNTSLNHLAVTSFCGRKFQKYFTLWVKTFLLISILIGKTYPVPLS